MVKAKLWKDLNLDNKLRYINVCAIAPVSDIEQKSEKCQVTYAIKYWLRCTQIIVLL
ncbi:hypothetical protein [Rivularia sp. PCC 7116]|uniref:hypothetical protein n=1 Tax=Rivularia sp. PCC 7116 TaxID=373994 RepID=UPI0002E6C663|nr:hypothetical protein [Rivularia sp. PCC 7116]